MSYTIDRLAAWQRAIMDGARGTSWHDRRRAASRPLSFADLAEMHRVAYGAEHDARSELCDRLVEAGAVPGFHARAIDVRLGAWWFVAPLMGRSDGPLMVHWCGDAAPSEWGEDWLCEDVDSDAPETQRVQTLRDGLSLVLTGGHGVEVYETARRVEPFALKGRKGDR